jgi:hypothetical protein
MEDYCYSSRHGGYYVLRKLRSHQLTEPISKMSDWKGKKALSVNPSSYEPRALRVYSNSGQSESRESHGEEVDEKE